MKLPFEPSQTRPRGSAPGTKKPSEVEPPKEPFINLSNTGPVDPARFQRFIVPMEFIEKANELDLSQMGDEGELEPGLEQMSNAAGRDAENEDTPESPRAGLMATDANDEVTPAYTKTPSVEPPPPLLPDARADAHEPLTPPEATRLPEQATTEVVPRRPVGVIARWQLSGKMPNSVRVAIAVVVMLVCVLIWAYSHVEAGGPATVESADIPASAEAPPLREQPVAKVRSEPQLQPGASVAGAASESASASSSKALMVQPTPRPAGQANTKPRAPATFKVAPVVQSKPPNEIPIVPSTPSATPVVGKMPWREPD